MSGTEDDRKALAELLAIPVDDVLHYAVVVHASGERIAVRFCGLPRNAIMLHAEAIRYLAEHEADVEAAKLRLGAHACEERS